MSADAVLAATRFFRVRAAKAAVRHEEPSMALTFDPRTQPNDGFREATLPGIVAAQAGCAGSDATGGADASVS
jgi:hypothetical protein